MSDTLARIVADKRAHVADRKAAVPEAALRARADAADPPRGFRAALARQAAQRRPALIAELKKASPSKGLIRADFDPPALARAYAAGGAACLSVLTDTPYFQGEDAFLPAARDAVDLPVLRKDFMVDPYQIAESRALGADCILLILAALEDALAAELMAAAGALGMDVLVEVHDRLELDRALAMGAGMIGINNRNLKTLQVDLATAESLAPALPPEVLAVGESGLGVPADLERLMRAGVYAFLIGESFMRQPDVTAAVRDLIGPLQPGAAASGSAA
ncbi:indole-3-glycerol phosphate synthase TrpC [Marinibaculum pumilum]|uniref:Indole-3-glycerol phosphate synthase n=1 Tax=Marinibaculum pumilum TaxID=1766165 RepID=A0ABV7KV05_9PROT